MTGDSWDVDGSIEEAKILADMGIRIGAPEPKNLGDARLMELMRDHDPFDKLAVLFGEDRDEYLPTIRRLAAGRLTDDFGNATLTPHVVLSADIRKSTFLMKEAANLSRFAQIMTDFILRSQQVVSEHGGWFDKFMGDGFLAYWPCELYVNDSDPGTTMSELSSLLDAACYRHWKGQGPNEYVSPPTTTESAQAYGVASCLQVAERLVRSFEDEFIPRFRRTTRNFLSATGLTVGVDIGEVLMVSMDKELAIVGHPIVGAVRATGAGGKSEIIANTPVWAAVRNAVGPDAARAVAFINEAYRFTRRNISTKEYEQEAYVVTGNRIGDG